MKSTTDPAQIEDVIIGVLADQGIVEDRNSVRRDVPLDELEVDSLIQVELTVRLGQELDTHFDDGFIRTSMTIVEIAAAVAEQLNAADLDRAEAGEPGHG